jgi:hypothetical protein
MSDLKKKFEVLDYLKRNKSLFHHQSARKVALEVKKMFDIQYSDYLMRKMMVAADIKVNVHKMVKISVPSETSEPTQLDRMEKKLDFVCDFIQYAKTGETPQ